HETRRMLTAISAPGKSSVASELLRPNAGGMVMNTREVGQRLVDLCKDGKNLDAISELYDDDIESHEATAPPEMMHVKGIDGVRKKNEWWAQNVEQHSAKVEGPFVNGNEFATIFEYDITSKTGPNAGKRSQMREIAVYTVTDAGKIVKEEFLY